MAIHESFYTNEFVEVAAFHKGVPAVEQVAFVEKTVPLRPGDAILDLACGFGRHSLVLAERGYNVVGMDQSPDYIARAVADNEHAARPARFIQGDMRGLDMPDAFDVVLSLQSSLAFYDDKANRGIFRRVCSALKPGGSFFFDQANVFLLATYAAQATPSRETLPDGRTHVKSMTFDAETCVASGRTVIESDEGRIESGWDLRFYTLPEVRALADETGFEVTASYGDFDGSGYSTTSQRLITLWRKR